MGCHAVVGPGRAQFPDCARTQVPATSFRRREGPPPGTSRPSGREGPHNSGIVRPAAPRGARLARAARVLLAGPHADHEGVTWTRASSPTTSSPRTPARTRARASCTPRTATSRPPSSCPWAPRPRSRGSLPPRSRHSAPRSCSPTPTTSPCAPEPTSWPRWGACTTSWAGTTPSSPTPAASRCSATRSSAGSPTTACASAPWTTTESGSPGRPRRTWPSRRSSARTS